MSPIKKTNQITLAEQGAARQVAGSTLLINIGNESHLVDCGLGAFSKTPIEQLALPVKPENITSVIISHAHTDHIHFSPMLHNKGFKGKFYSTPETADLFYLQFRQDLSSTYLYNQSIKGKRFVEGPNKGQYIPFKRLAYTSQDLKDMMRLFPSGNDEKRGIDYGEPFQASEGLRGTLYEAGHIPGSAQIVLEINKDGNKINILNACDLGRTDYDTPIVNSPQKDFPVDIDYVVIEATYGDRVHAPIEASLKTLEQSVLDTDKNKGKLVMPAFSMMRTQQLWSFLYDLTRQGKAPDDYLFYSSSPSADDVSKVMLKYISEMDQKAQKNLSRKGDNYFDFDKLIHHQKMEETLNLIESSKEPFGIVASSGMCDYGRVVSILEKTISDPRNIVMLTGYCSPGTRGDLMMKKAPKILFESGYVDLRADVRKMGGLSGHADVNEITSHLKYIAKSQGKPFKGIFIKHGESEQCEGLKSALIRSGFDKSTVHVMEKGQEYVL